MSDEVLMTFLAEDAGPQPCGDINTQLGRMVCMFMSGHGGRHSSVDPHNASVCYSWWGESDRHHDGLCCSGCYDEYENGTGVMMDGWCCCKDERGSS